MLKQPNQTEKRVLPVRLGKTTKKKSIFDEIVAKWCRESNEKIPVAPLTIKEKELLQQTLVNKGLCENDFVTMATRQKLGADKYSFHDDRRPLPL
jgi:hypothetical protein